MSTCGAQIMLQENFRHNERESNYKESSEKPAAKGVYKKGYNHIQRKGRHSLEMKVQVSLATTQDCLVTKGQSKNFHEVVSQVLISYY